MKQEIVCESCDAILRIDSFVDEDNAGIVVTQGDVQDAVCFNCGVKGKLYVRRSDD